MLGFLSFICAFCNVTMAMLSHQDLMQACKSGDVQATRRLLEYLDPSDCNSEAFLEASHQGHSEVVALLLADPRVDPSASDNYAIRITASEGHTDLLKLLLADPRVDPKTNDDEAIRYASYMGHSKIVQLLLADKRVDPSACDNEAIIVASSQGHSEVVQLLLADPRVDPLDCRNNATRLASISGHAMVVEALLADPRIDPSFNNNEAICDASNGGNTYVVKLLLAHPKVLPSIEIIQKTFENSELKVEFFQAATNPAGLVGLMQLANIANGLTLELLDILISRAKGIQLNQKFLHSLRLSKLPIPVEIRAVYATHLAALFQVSSSSDVLKLVEITVYLAEMGIHADVFRLITQFL